jgi:hypothetical protein
MALGLGAAAATAADFETPVTLPPGSQLEVTVAHTRSGTRTREPTTTTVHYRHEIDPRGEGYVVRLRLMGIDDPPGISEYAKAKRAEVLNASPASNLSYDADKALKPLRVNDWPQVIARAQRVPLGNDKASRGMAAIARRIIGDMSPEQAAGFLLREQQLPAAAQGVLLDLRRPVSEPRRMTSPLGGLADGVYTMELESLDKAKNRAVIRISSRMDSASAMRDLESWVRAWEKATPDAPKPTPERIAAIKVERSTECRYEMDLVTGLAVTSDCTETELGPDGDLGQFTRAERWVITQAVVRRD